MCDMNIRIVTNNHDSSVINRFALYCKGHFVVMADFNSRLCFNVLCIYT
jgi:hypothetical protein